MNTNGMPEHLRLSRLTEDQVADEIVRLAGESGNAEVLLRGDDAVPPAVREATARALQQTSE